MNPDGGPPIGPSSNVIRIGTHMGAGHGMPDSPAGAGTEKRRCLDKHGFVSDELALVSGVQGLPPGMPQVRHAAAVVPAVRRPIAGHSPNPLASRRAPLIWV